MESSGNETGCPGSYETDARIIDVTRDETSLTFVSSANVHNSSNALQILVTPSREVQSPVAPSSSSAPSSSNARLNFSRSENYNDRTHQRSPLNSGFWISVELIFVLGQILAAIVILSVSRNEKPRTPLFAWVIGYSIGCIVILPHLYWRYTHRQGISTRNLTHSNSTIQGRTFEENDSVTTTPSSNPNTGNTNTRFSSLIDRFKMALDFFFAIWFVVGNVWVFGQHSSASDAPNLFRLCIVFLVFSCIGYAMPIIICMVICCCFPCVTSYLVSEEDLIQYRGARSEHIDALPTYKFKSKRCSGRSCETSNDANGVGGIVAAGTEKERILSAEDAVCCICLSVYADKDELRELACAHLFHKKCVDEWLKRNALCPLCKSSISRIRSSSSCRNLGFGSL